MADNFSAQVDTTVAASATRPLLGLAAGASAEIGELYYLTFGSVATPAEQVFQLKVQRMTTAGTSSTYTPHDLSGAGATASTVCRHTYTADPTLTANTIMLNVPVHQRALYQFYATPNQTPGRGLKWPATQYYGLAVLVPVGPLVAVSLTAHWREG